MAEKSSADSESGLRLTAELAARAKSLEMLYDYTKFHIGLYLTLTASYIAVATIKTKDALGDESALLETNPYFLWSAVFFFVLAGLSGGVIASSITQHIGGSSEDFLNKQIGPWRGKAIHMAGRKWTYVEHTSFWLGLICAIFSFAFPRV
jgi:hypothetical protein